MKRALAALAIGISLLVQAAAAPTRAQTPTGWTAPPAATFRQVVLPPTPEPPQGVPVAPGPALTPEPTTGATPAAEPAPKATGEASWYCNADTARGRLSRCHRDYPDAAGPDLYAAAGPALRVGDWRGRTVLVCDTGQTCVSVTLVDWCACPERVIDLYADAFERVGTLSRGEVDVTVSWAP